MGLQDKTKAAAKNIEGNVQETVSDLTDNSGQFAVPLNGTT